jgi:phosphomannomutase
LLYHLNIKNKFCLVQRLFTGAMSS